MIASPRVYLHLADDWLAGEYRRAAVRAMSAQEAQDVALTRSSGPPAIRRERRSRRPLLEMVAAMRRYRNQLGESLKPNSVDTMW